MLDPLRRLPVCVTRVPLTRAGSLNSTPSIRTCTGLMNPEPIAVSFVAVTLIDAIVGGAGLLTTAVITAALSFSELWSASLLIVGANLIAVPGTASGFNLRPIRKVADSSGGMGSNLLSSTIRPGPGGGKEQSQPVRQAPVSKFVSMGTGNSILTPVASAGPRLVRVKV